MTPPDTSREPGKPGGFMHITRQEKITLLVIFLIAITYAVWHVHVQRSSGPNLGSDIEPPGSMVAVQVEGAVVNPGMVKVNKGASRAEAIQAAGGLLPNAEPDNVGLDKTVVGGERIDVPFKGVPESAGSGSTSGIIDLNNATMADLQTLPGIGPMLARRIIDYRVAHGPYKSIEEFMNVEGIGQGKFDQIKRFITVGN